METQRKLKYITISIPSELAVKLEEARWIARKTRSEYCCSAIKKALDEEAKAKEIKADGSDK